MFTLHEVIGSDGVIAQNGGYIIYNLNSSVLSKMPRDYTALP